MGRKVKWFDTVQKILSTSEPADHAETEAKAAKLRDKPSFKKIWQFGKSSSSGASTSTSAAPAPGLDAEAPQHQQPPSPWPAKQHAEEKIIAEESMATIRCEEGERVCHPAAEAAAPVPKAGAGAAPMAAAAAAIAGAAVTSPTAWIARSKEDIAATRIQAACRGYLARRPPQERAIGRLMSLVEGFTVKRQTEEALYCMQTMTRIQTQIYSRRLKTEEDKKALKSQVKVNKQSLDKIKIGEGWDHSLQSKEQMEAVLTMKQEAASRRQRALSYAFSHQWRNRNPSSARGAAPAPTFMDPGNPNWGWGWTERWMAAARPWENQTAAAPDDGRAAARSAGRQHRVAVSILIPTSTTAPDDGRAAARSAGRQHRVAVSILIPTSTTTTTTPRGGSKPFRPPSWPSLPSPSTPPPRSPSLSGRTTGVPASPRSGPLHHAASGLQRTKSLQPDRRPRSSQERSASSQELSVSSPRRAVPASPRRSGSGSPLHPSSGLARAPSQQTERRPRSSQERAVSSPRSAGKDAAPTLRRTTSLRAELPRRLSLGSAAAATPAGDDAGAPVTPSYMQPTKSVRAKIGCQSPSALAVADVFDAPESGPAPLQLPSPSSAKKRMSLAFADNKPSASSPSKVAAGRVRRHSQPPSPRMSSLT